MYISSAVCRQPSTVQNTLYTLYISSAVCRQLGTVRNTLYTLYISSAVCRQPSSSLLTWAACSSALSSYSNENRWECKQAENNNDEWHGTSENNKKCCELAKPAWIQYHKKAKTASVAERVEALALLGIPQRAVGRGFDPR